MVYDITRRSTYNHISSWLTDARNLTNPNTVSKSWQMLKIYSANQINLVSKVFFFCLLTVTDCMPCHFELTCIC